MSELHINCPYCSQRGKGEDTSRNLNIAATGVYHCFRCGAKPSETGRLPLHILSELAIKPTVPDTPATRSGEIQDPHPVHCCEECSRYLIEREYDPNVVAAAPFVVGGEYMGHRIFFKDLSTNWWQGRAVSPRNGLRYMSNPAHNLDGKPALLDMMPDITDNRTDQVPVLVEGPFDGLRLWCNGLRAVVLCGVVYSDWKLARVQCALWGARKAILCLDRDNTMREQYRWLNGLAKFMPVRNWQLEAKDPSEMGVEELHNLMEEVLR